MKAGFALALTIVLAICLGRLSAQSHNVIWGYMSPYDKILVRENIHSSFGFLRIVTEDYVFPPTGHFNYFDITAVRCVDNYKDGAGGYCTLVKGGPGLKFVNLRLKSQRNHGYNFTIEIYGR